MLRVKRSVQATYNTQVNLMTANMLAQQKKDDDADRLHRLAQEDEMAKLESQAIEEKEEERRRMTAAPGANAITFTAAREEPVQPEANPEEIELEEEEEAEESMQTEEASTEEAAKAKAKGKSVKIEQMELPSTLFGGLKEQAEQQQKQQQQQQPTGALARFKRGGGQA